MRCLMAILGLVALGVPAQAQEDPRKFFEALEQKLIKAKGYKVDFESETSDFRWGLRKGILIVASGNRFKVHSEVTNKTGDRIEVNRITDVCDGKTMINRLERHLEKPEIKKSDRPAHDKLQEALSGWFLREGVVLARFRASQASSATAFRDLEMFDFKLTDKEKALGRPALFLEYKLKSRAFDGHTSHTLWLDAETGLPLKLVVEFSTLRVTDTYRNWELDPKLPEGTFELPK